METETPSSAMYAAFKEYGVANKELARIVLSETLRYGDGGTPRDRITERTFLSREVVHAAPGRHDAAFFAPFERSADAVAALLIRKNRTANSVEQLNGAWSTVCCRRMCEALAACGADARLYLNMVEHLATLPLSRETERLALHVLLFTATGCLGDVRAACKLVNGRIMHLGCASGTTALGEEEWNAPRASSTLMGDSRLGLCRMVKGRMSPRISPLSEAEEGTVIGTITTAVAAITDVKPPVSREHMRIFRDFAGNWYAQGLASTNGSTILRGDSEQEVVIEAPRVYRSSAQKDARSAPVRIYPGDILVLARAARFLVVEIAE